MFSSASEVFINALCRVVTTYKIVVFKFQFVCMVNLNCILAIFPEWGQKVPPLSLCFQNVLYVAAIQLEKAGLDHLLRHILAVDADGRSGRADSIKEMLAIAESSRP